MWACSEDTSKELAKRRLEDKALPVGKYPKQECPAGAGWSGGKNHEGADNLELSRKGNGALEPRS